MKAALIISRVKMRSWLRRFLQFIDLFFQRKAVLGLGTSVDTRKLPWKVAAGTLTLGEQRRSPNEAVYH